MKQGKGLLVGLAVLLTACGPAGSLNVDSGMPGAQISQTKRITVAILGEPHTLSQAINSAGTGSIRGVGEVERMMHAGVTMLDGKGLRVAQLAEAATTVENGLWKVLPDGGMETRWTIRAGAKWHDGTPFSAEDLLFSARVYRDAELALPSNPGFRSITSVEAPDVRTVLVKWDKPYIEADQMFSYGFVLPIPKHLLEAPYLNDKASFLELPYWTTGFVGAGAYRLKEFVRASHMELAAFSEYLLGPPRIDQIVVKFLQDPNVLIANVLAGEVELTLGRGLSLEQAVEVDQQWDGSVVTRPSNWIAHYPQFLTPNPPVVAQLEFRKALIHAMDRMQISNHLQGGRAQVAHSILSYGDPMYSAVESQVVKYAYDERRAQQLIEGLGYQKRADGFFYDANGQKLLVESRTNAGDDLKEKILLATADYWRRSGVDVDVVVSPRQRASDREYRATFPGFDLVRQPFDPIRFLSREAPLPDNSWRGNNRMRYTNPQLDSLIDRYFTTIPLQERTDIVGQMVHILSDQAVALGTIYGAEPTLIGKRLMNVGAELAEGADETWNVQQWDVR